MSQCHLIHTSNYGYPFKTLSFTLPLEIPHLIPLLSDKINAPNLYLSISTV